MLDARDFFRAIGEETHVQIDVKDAESVLPECEPCEIELALRYAATHYGEIYDVYYFAPGYYFEEQTYIYVAIENLGERPDEGEPHFMDLLREAHEYGCLHTAF